MTNSLTEIISKVIETNNSAFFYTPPIYKKAKSYYFSKIKDLVSVCNVEDLQTQRADIENILKNHLGFSLANYEASKLFESKLDFIKTDEEPLLQFYFYNKSDVKEYKSIEIIHDYKYPVSRSKLVNEFKLNVGKQDYINKIKEIKNFISKGDTYQVNYTLKANYKLNKSIQEIFNVLLFNQSAKFTAIINIGKSIIISVSPELFFTVNKKKIITSPMKGTIKRGVNLKEDKLNKLELKTNEKEKAENLMIVDLLRNDLGRISKYGSVKTNKLFKVEKYESLFQMISIIEAKLKTVNLLDILKEIFPCGSITGAPKIRTMEIINLLESEKRGLYTGSIGLLLKDTFVFNVAIRTLLIDKTLNTGEIGLGSGIVWDSKANNEYNEVKLKGRYLTNPEKYFEIFESILIENRNPFLLKEHLKRLEKAAEYFLFSFNKKKVTKEIEKVIEKTTLPSYKLKVQITKWGDIKTYVEPINDPPSFIKCVISSKKVSTQNRFQYFKTTNRNLYASELKKNRRKGFYEVLFLNEKEQIAEGSFTNILIKKSGRFFTPSINSGILNGIYRDFLLKQEAVFEKELNYNDLVGADEIMLINSVRKGIFVDEVWNDGICVYKKLSPDD